MVFPELKDYFPSPNFVLSMMPTLIKFPLIMWVWKENNFYSGTLIFKRTCSEGNADLIRVILFPLKQKLLSRVYMSIIFSKPFISSIVVFLSALRRFFIDVDPHIRWFFSSTSISFASRRETFLFVYCTSHMTFFNSYSIRFYLLGFITFLCQQ